MVAFLEVEHKEKRLNFDEAKNGVKGFDTRKAKNS